MLANFISILIYGFLFICIADLVLYITVKIKERKHKKEIKDNTQSTINVDFKEVSDQKK